MVCDKDVCERWCVTKMCVSPVTKGTQARHQTQPFVRSASRACRQAPRLPRKSAVASRATKGAQARHQTQPCVRSASPATQNDSHVSEVPCLLRKTNVDVAKCHACHAKVPRRHRHHQTQPCVRSATLGRPSKPKRATRPSHVSEVPRLPCKRNVHVAKCHACHAKVPRRHGRPRGPKRATRPSHVSEAPRLPRKSAETKVERCV